MPRILMMSGNIVLVRVRFDVLLEGMLVGRVPADPAADGYAGLLHALAQSSGAIE